MQTLARISWLVVLLLIANDQRLAAQASPPSAAVPPPAVTAQAYDPEQPVAPPPTRQERRRQRQWRARSDAADPGVIIAASLMVVGGVTAIAVGVPALFPTTLGGEARGLSPTRAVFVGAGVVTFALGGVILIVTLAKRHSHRYARGPAPPMAAGTFSPVLLRF